MKSYRGNLTLHADAKIEDHRNIVTKYLRELKKKAAKHAATIEVHLTAHITGNAAAPASMHYDLLCYSDLPKTTLKQIVRTAWEKVGGRSATVPEMESEEEKTRVIKYTTKDTKKARE